MGSTRYGPGTSFTEVRGHPLHRKDALDGNRPQEAASAVLSRLREWPVVNERAVWSISNLPAHRLQVNRPDRERGAEGRRRPLLRTLSPSQPNARTHRARAPGASREVRLGATDSQVRRDSEPPAEGSQRYLRFTALEAAGRYPHLSRPRLHHQQSGIHPRPRARQQKGEKAFGRDRESKPGSGLGDDAGPGKRGQYLLPAAQPVGDCGAA